VLAFKYRGTLQSNAEIIPYSGNVSGMKPLLAVEHLAANPPERSWIPLYILNEADKIVTKLKLQKIVFLLQNEAKIPSGYAYYKYLYGPYSRELELDTSTLDNLKLICKKEVIGIHNAYWEFSSTISGRKLFQDIRPKINKHLLDRMQNVLNKYIKMDHNEITAHVYEKYYLNREREINEKRRVLLSNIDSMIAFYESVYFPECPAIIDILAFSEYCSMATKKMDSFQDPVTQSVIVNACGELIDRLSELGKFCAEERICLAKAEKKLCRYPDPSIHEIFLFIEDYCAKKEILPRLSEIDFSELMSGEDFERLRKAFEEPSAKHSY